MAGAALDPLRSLYRVLSEGALEGTEEGDKVTARIKRLEAQILVGQVKHCRTGDVASSQL